MRTRLFLLLAFSSLSAAWAFQTPTSSSASHHAVHSRPSLVVVHGRMTPLRHNQHDSPKSLLPLHQSKTSTSSSSSSSWTTVAARTATTTALLWLGSLQLAVADSPDWGVLEGRTGSLLHPIMMGSLLLYSLYTGYLGLQWRRQRTAGDEIKRLQAALPKLDDKKDNEETPDPAVVAQRQAGQAEIAALQQQRKDLAAAGPRDRHYSQGALLAFLGTAFAIEVSVSFVCLFVRLFACCGCFWQCSTPVQTGSCVLVLRLITFSYHPPPHRYLDCTTTS